MPLTVISGGPGRGKTFVAKHLVEQYPEAKVILAAPTGKAALRLKESLDKEYEVGTIHSLLGIKREEDFFGKNFFLDADLIVVDECSMIDSKLFAAFFSAIKDNARVILMGDENQLPPVESGSIFSEICQFAKGRTFYAHLTKSMRTDRVEILDLAERILLGREVPFTREFHLPEVFWDYANSLAHAKSPEKALQVLGGHMVLSCLRKGMKGTAKINDEICEKLGKNITLPILITKNDYRLDLMNGEMGIIFEDMAYFSNGKKIPRVLLPSYELAFVLSVHKSQGSEFDGVTVLIPEGSESFGREILYTAVTRAKKEVQIIAQEAIMNEVLQKTSQKNSCLCERLSFS